VENGKKKSEKGQNLYFAEKFRTLALTFLDQSVTYFSKDYFNYSFL